MDDEPTYDGPRIGDTVAVSTRGRVVELYAKAGTPGVTVTLEHMGTTWVPLTNIVVLED
jgi:hypothetical protein